MTASRAATGSGRSRAQPARAKKPAKRAPTQKSPSRKQPSRKPAAWASRAAVLVVSGTLWAVVLIVGVSLSPFTAAVVLIPVSAVATASMTARRRRGRGRQGSWTGLIGPAASVVLPLAALAGPIAAISIAALVVAASISLQVAGGGPVAGSWRAITSAVGPPLAAMCVVLARGQGTNEAIALVIALCAYDMAAFLMGNSQTPSGGPLGIAAGWASIAVVGLFSTAVMDPPFSGGRTIVMFGLVALLAPAGVLVASWLAGRSRAPALRRLDSFLLAAPAWVVGVAFVLHQ